MKKKIKNTKKYIHTTKLTLISGNGGDGHISFYRNKFNYKGGPDGGNGGNGGNIYIIANKNIDNLNHFRYKEKIIAENGKKGQKKNCTGKNGKNKYLNVPIGSIIKNQKNNKLICQLKKEKETYLICKGGKHGIGNNKFKSSINRTPKQYTKGKKGEKTKIKIILTYYIDIIIIGLPNTGKSSLLKILSNSKPKINNYPFTTLYPNIGILVYKKKKTNYKIIDIPNIIKKKKKKTSHLKFLKFINYKKCKIILHVVELNENIHNIFHNIKTILYELYNYKNTFYKKKHWIIFNKLDLNLYSKINIKKKINHWKKKLKWTKHYIISITKKSNVKKLKKKLHQYLTKINQKNKF